MILGTRNSSECVNLDAQMVLLDTQNRSIFDLQSIPRESNKKDVAAMLVELTIEGSQ